VIFSHVLYQLSYLGEGPGDPKGVRFKQSGSAESSRRGKGRLAGGRRAGRVQSRAMKIRLDRLALLLLLPLSLPAAPAAAWTPKTQVTIAWEAARLAPRDLYRQIYRERKEFEAGVGAPFDDSDALRHAKNGDGTGSLDRVIEEAVVGAIEAIRKHRPFTEIVRRMGTLSHFVADANNPLATSNTDAEESRYFADFLRYAQSAEPRFPLVFYGLMPALDRSRDVAPLLAQTFARGRELYPLVGQEYRKIDYASGLGRFDDRSTAFGVASLSFSHAVTDIALVMRYVWLKAGGGDDRSDLPAGGTRILLLHRGVRPGP
jgi:hypothetical protein